MCKLSDSAAMVRKAARDLREAIEGAKPANGIDQALRQAFPIDHSIPDEFRGQLRQIRQPRAR